LLQRKKLKELPFVETMDRISVKKDTTSPEDNLPALQEETKGYKKDEYTLQQDDATLQLKKEYYQLRNEYLRLKIQKLKIDQPSQQINNFITKYEVSESVSPRTHRRPRNSEELRQFSSEFARNEDYYTKERDKLIDGRWYLIYKQEIVAQNDDKNLVVDELFKLPSDDYLLIQKGEENTLHEVNHIEISINNKDGKAQVIKVKIMSYDGHQTINDDAKFIIDTGAAVTCVEKKLIECFPERFKRTNNITLETASGILKSFMYRCDLKFDASSLSVDVVPLHKNLLGRDLLRSFKMEWDRWQQVTLALHPGVNANNNQ
jgi:predicted aspartyl protease